MLSTIPSSATGGETFLGKLQEGRHPSRLFHLNMSRGTTYGIRQHLSLTLFKEQGVYCKVYIANKQNREENAIEVCLEELKNTLICSVWYSKVTTNTAERLLMRSSYLANSLCKQFSSSETTACHDLRGRAPPEDEQANPACLAARSWARTHHADVPNERSEQHSSRCM